MLEQKEKQFFREYNDFKDAEEQLKHFLLVIGNAMPYIKRGMKSSYGEEFERIQSQHMYNILEHIAGIQNKFEGYSDSEKNLILRYHSQAIIGLFSHLTDDDLKNLDSVIHMVFLIISSNTANFRDDIQ